MMSRFSSRYACLEEMRLSYLLVTLSACAVAVAMIWFAFAAHRRVMAAEPYVIGIDRVTGEGFALRPSVLRPGPAKYEDEVRRDLAEFVRLHDERILGTVDRDYPESLLFLGERLRSMAARQQEADEISRFIKGQGDETRVAVYNVTIHGGAIDCRDAAAPCRAHLVFERIMRDRTTHVDRARKMYSGELSFIYGEVDPSVRLVNPLGLVVTDLREYEVLSSAE